MLWLIGGTGESAQLSALLSEAGIPHVVSVTTPAAQSLYPKGQVVVGSLSPASLPTFLARHDIDRILDASHPFAVEISRLAIATGLAYLRFERASLAGGIRLPNIEAVLQPHYLQARRVLLTVGMRWLPHFLPWLGQSELWARILPASRPQAVALGFPPERLILARLPLSEAEEERQWRAVAVDTVITKASGQAGGQDIKHNLALRLGVRLIVIDRPEIDYPAQTDSLPVALAFGQRS